MANPSTAAQLNTTMLSTLERYGTRFEDNITSGSGILNYMKGKNLVTYEKLTGREEIIPILYQTSDQGQWFDDMDTFQFTPQDPGIEGRAGHFNYQTGAYISMTEELENEGKEKIASLLDRRIKQMEVSARKEIAQAIVGAKPTTTSKLPEGIRDLMGCSEAAKASIDFDADTTTAAATQGIFHGLNPSTYSWWTVNTRYAPDALTKVGVGLKRDLLALFNAIRADGGEPKVGIADNGAYLIAAQFLTPSQLANVTYSGDRPQGKPAKVNLGAPSLWVDNAEIIFDPYYTTVTSTDTLTAAGGDGSIAFIDTDFFQIKIDPRMNFKLMRSRDPDARDEQLYNAVRMLFRMNLNTCKRNAHGIVAFNYA